MVESESQEPPINLDSQDIPFSMSDPVLVSTPETFTREQERLINVLLDHPGTKPSMYLSLLNISRAIYHCVCTSQSWNTPPSRTFNQ